MDSLTLIKKHEGMRLKVYNDTEGIPTIGIGRNLKDVGITEDMAFAMLSEDMEHVYESLSKYLWYNDMDEVRQAVVENMMFNLGASRFAGFRNTIQLIDERRYGDASIEMLNSKWARQVGNRAQELSVMMETGKWL